MTDTRESEVTKQFIEMFEEGVNVWSAIGNFVGEIIRNTLFIVICSPIWLVGAIKRLLTNHSEDNE